MSIVDAALTCHVEKQQNLESLAKFCFLDLGQPAIQNLTGWIWAKGLDVITHSTARIWNILLLRVSGHLLCHRPSIGYPTTFLKRHGASTCCVGRQPSITWEIRISAPVDVEGLGEPPARLCTLHPHDSSTYMLHCTSNSLSFIADTTYVHWCNQTTAHQSPVSHHQQARCRTSACRQTQPESALQLPSTASPAGTHMLSVQLSSFVCPARPSFSSAHLHQEAQSFSTSLLALCWEMALLVTPLLQLLSFCVPHPWCLPHPIAPSLLWSVSCIAPSSPALCLCHHLWLPQVLMHSFLDLCLYLFLVPCLFLWSLGQAAFHGIALPSWPAAPGFFLYIYN